MSRDNDDRNYFLTADKIPETRRDHERRSAIRRVELRFGQDKPIASLKHLRELGTCEWVADVYNPRIMRVNTPMSGDTFWIDTGEGAELATKSDRLFVRKDG